MTRTHRPDSTLFLTTLLGAAVGCSNPSPQTEQSLPAPTGIPWVADVPSLTFRIPDSIGGASSEMGRAAFLGNGRIAVGDYDGKRILLFDSTGNLTRIIGRGGSGPGEFQAPTLVQTFAADSLLVWDASLRRLSFLSATTGTGTAIQLPATVAYGGRPIVGLLENRRIVIRNEQFAPDPLSGLVQVTTTLGLLSPGHDHLDPIVEWPAVPRGDASGFRFFESSVQAALVGEQLTVGYGAAWPLITVNMRGDTTGILTRPWQPRPVTEADRATVREAMTRPNLAPGFLDDDRFDPTYPAFGTILPGADGTTWVQGYAPPYLGPDSATVFGADSHLLTVLALPTGFRPTDITPDLILGHGTSADGDFEIRVYGVRYLTSDGTAGELPAMAQPQ